MDRLHKVWSVIDRKGAGLEIGPSHRPMAPKKEGFNVEILDHASQQELIEKYRAHGVDLSAIEPVDYVWHGETYAELTGKRDHYKWVIASHVIEHTPDLIGFINGCDEVLTDDGILMLAVPDKRYCFDHLRQKSSLAQLIDAHDQKRTNHTAGTAADYFLNVVAMGKQGAWAAGHKGDLSFFHTLDDAKGAMEAIRGHNAYLDMHAWCFTPSSFRLLMHDLWALGITRLREVAFFDTKGCEFMVGLSRSGTGPTLDRKQLAVRSLAE